MRRTSRTAAATAILGVLGVPALVWLVLQDGPHAVSFSFLFVLGGVAALAELMPIDIPGRAVGATFTLPYITTAALFCSPRFAIGIEACVLMLGCLAISARRSWVFAFLNLSIAGLGLVPAVLTGRLCVALFTGPDATPFAVIPMMVAYLATVNAVIVCLRTFDPRGQLGRLALGLTDLDAMRLGAYALLGVVVSVIARDSLTSALLLTLVPIWALRVGLRTRAKMSESYYETVTALTLMLQRAHPSTHLHVDRVARTAESVARRLGLRQDRAELVRAAAVLHDIGKIAVDEAILDKPGGLTEHEREHVKSHANAGAEILAPVRSFHDLLPWIRHHHERPDGKGYPDGLSDVEIPIESKIIAVVDAFDAMTDTTRKYRPALSQAAAVDELRLCAGSQFDTSVVEAFAEILVGAESD